MHLNYLETLLELECGLYPRVSGSVGVGWGLRVCTSNQFPGDAAAAVLETTLGEALL